MKARLQRWRSREGWNELVFALALLAFSLAVWVFAELVDDAVEGDYLETERTIMLAFRQPDNPAVGLGGPWMLNVVRDITALGSVAVLVLLVGLVIGLLLLKGRRRTACFILIATVGGTVIGSAVKTLLARPRPDIVPHLMEVTSLSFPSGHSMMSSVVYLTLGALLGQTMARRREKIYLFGAAILLTVLVGLSRVYLGVHYPTDVLAGWSAGTAWALACWIVGWWLQQRGQLRKPE
jgi:undecaprenyl-diphosphatase